MVPKASFRTKNRYIFITILKGKLPVSAHEKINDHKSGVINYEEDSPHGDNVIASEDDKLCCCGCGGPVGS